MKDVYKYEEIKNLIRGAWECGVVGNWAVSKSKKSYLIKKPSFVKEDFSGKKYIFVYLWRVYEIWLTNEFGNDAKITRVGSDGVDEDVKQAVTCAFEVFGRYGTGASKSGELAENYVIPEF